MSAVKRRAKPWARQWLPLLLCLPLQALAQAAATHPLQAAQPASAPEEVLLAVEIPAGGSIKYEIGADGLLHADRFLSAPVAYPANYGSMPRTLAGDHDPLDALVLTRAPLHPGTLIRFRPIGVLRMVDQGERDEKVVGVPADDVDPGFAHIRDLADLPATERARIETFFRIYKAPTDADDRVALHGWGDAAEARRLIAQSMQAFAHAARDR